jgi:transcriptional regulator with XRE-family HTH domain
MLTSVRRVRLERGLKQYDVAASAGLHPSRLSLIETAREQPKPGELQALARALGVPVELLASQENAPTY